MSNKQTLITIEIKPKFHHTSVNGKRFLQLVMDEFLYTPLKGSIRTMAGDAKWKVSKV